MKTKQISPEVSLLKCFVFPPSQIDAYLHHIHNGLHRLEDLIDKINEMYKMTAGMYRVMGYWLLWRLPLDGGVRSATACDFTNPSK